LVLNFQSITEDESFQVKQRPLTGADYRAPVADKIRRAFSSVPYYVAQSHIGEGPASVNMAAIVGHMEAAF